MYMYNQDNKYECNTLLFGYNFTVDNVSVLVLKMVPQ